MAPPGLKMRAATVAEAVMEEEAAAALMVEVLVNVTLATTIARKMQTTSDNKQQSTIGYGQS